MAAAGGGEQRQQQAATPLPPPPPPPQQQPPPSASSSMSPPQPAPPGRPAAAAGGTGGDSDGGGDDDKPLAQVLTERGALQFVGGLVVGLLLRGLGRRRRRRDGDGDGGGGGGTRKKRGAGKRAPAGASASGASRPAVVMAPREELKMVLCVNQALKMRAGKIGAQCAHAAVGVLCKYRVTPQAETLFRMWERCGQPKIALKAADEYALAQLQQTAAAKGLPTYLVHDAGRTQVAAGSQTVLAIGPGYKSEIDKVTGHLSLL